MLLAESFYETQQLDYSKLFNFSSYKKESEQEEVYKNEFEINFSDTQSETMTDEEAHETLEDIQYSQALGNSTNVDYVTRKKFANWVAFNPVLMRLFESQSFTRDVNYSEF
jgi:hypothetical protein